MTGSSLFLWEPYATSDYMEQHYSSTLKEIGGYIYIHMNANFLDLVFDNLETHGVGNGAKY